MLPAPAHDMVHEVGAGSGLRQSVSVLQLQPHPPVAPVLVGLLAKAEDLKENLLRSECKTWLELHVNPSPIS